MEEYIIARGGIIDSGVKKTTDILMIGARECQAYSNGTYGIKVKKAMEYNMRRFQPAIVCRPISPHRIFPKLQCCL